MRNLIAFPILGLAVILQSSVVSRTTLLSGFADLPLVIVVAWALQDGVTTGWHWAVLGGMLVSFVSGMPWVVSLTAYLVAVVLAQVFQRRIWQAPMMAMLSVTFVATLVSHLLSWVVLSIFQTPLPIADAFSLVTLPSVLLNMLLAIPVFWLVRDLARWVVYAEEEE